MYSWHFRWVKRSKCLQFTMVFLSIVGNGNTIWEISWGFELLKIQGLVDSMHDSIKTRDFVGLKLLWVWSAFVEVSLAILLKSNKNSINDGTCDSILNLIRHVTVLFVWRWYVIPQYLLWKILASYVCIQIENKVKAYRTVEPSQPTDPTALPSTCRPRQPEGYIPKGKERRPGGRARGLKWSVTKFLISIIRFNKKII